MSAVAARELFAPTPAEIQAACEVLLRVEPMNSEARRVVRDRYAKAFRDAAFGLLRTAREYRDMNRPDEVARLVKSARWHWAQYRMENMSWH